MASIKTELIISAVTKGFKAVETSVKGLGKSFETAAEKASTAGKKLDGLDVAAKNIAKAGLAAGCAALLAFGKASITAASDVEEMQSKFDTVFGSLGGEVTDDLQGFADAANRSIFDLQGFAATLQDTFKPLGFAGDAAADMSVNMVQLATDLGSFNNIDTATVVNDLQSALVGNTETLRKYGIVASQSAIDNEAYALGLNFTKGRMDALTKATAIQSIIMKSTVDAQGDAIKTADSFANQMVGLKAAVQELSVTFGGALLPAATAVVGKLTEATDVVKGLQGQMGQMAEASDDGTSAFSNVLVVMNEINKAVGGIPVDDWIAGIRGGERAANAGAIATAELAAEIEESDSVLAALTQTTLDNIAADERAAAAHDLLVLSIRDGLDDGERLAVTWQDVKAAEEARLETAERMKEADEESALALFELEQAQAGYFQTALDGSLVQDDLNNAIFDAAAAAGASATELALLGGALGLYSEDAVNAALQSALIQAKIAELAGSFARGETTITEMRAELNGFISDIQNVPTSKTIDFHLNIPKIPPSLGGSVVPGGSAVAAAGGADFTVPAGFPNDSFPILAQSGEHVKITPAGQNGGVGGLTANINISIQNGDPATVRGSVTDGLLEAYRRKGEV